MAETTEPQLRVRIADGATELLVYALAGLCLASRASLPEYAVLPHAVVLSLAALVPVWLLSRRGEAGLVGRIALASSLCLLLQLRAPHFVPGLEWRSPTADTLRISIEALVVVGIALATLARGRCAVGDDARRALLRVTVIGTAMLLAWVALLWPMLTGALRAGGEEGLRWAPALRTASIVAECGVLFTATLLAEGTWRLRRLAMLLSLALVCRALLPPTGGN